MNNAPEMLKSGGIHSCVYLYLYSRLTNLFQAIWNGNTIPNDWNNTKGIILSFCKWKGIAAVTERTVVVRHSVGLPG